MDISGIAAVAIQLKQQRTADAVDIAVLKKAMAIQQETMSALLESVTPASALPPHLGQNVNTVA